MNTFLKIHERDNVLVALIDMPKGTKISLSNYEIELNADVQAKHKIFSTAIAKDELIIMYGVTVGKAMYQLNAGDIMHTENTYHAVEQYKYKGFVNDWQKPDVSKWQHTTFNGYHRNDGSVGTANYWLFIPMVFCENRNLDVIKEALHQQLGYAVTDKYKSYTNQLLKAYQDNANLENIVFENHTQPQNRVFKNIDGIKFLNHQGGCGGTRQDAGALGNLLAAYANHPNVGGVTVFSLGCQNLQTADFLEVLKNRYPSFDKPLLVYEQQQSQSEEQLISDAIKATFIQLIELNKIERSPAPLSKLTLGVKCGGSDGFSGISANPAVGYCSDLLVALNGKVLLAEFPELCGAEQNLLDRTLHEEHAQKFINLMETYNAQAKAVGSGFDMNPSPGNIRDGLITDAIKSNGAALKGGTSPIVDVLDYTEPATKQGLSLVCTPGNDVEATTGKAASGATLILFTTGLGTPTGNPVCPTIKVSTNSTLTKRMNDIIDIDCGGVVTGQKTIEQMGEEILNYCIAAASGEIVPKAVLLNQDDFIPWKRGVSL
jgi:altronate hydrolase